MFFFVTSLRLSDHKIASSSSFFRFRSDFLAFFARISYFNFLEFKEFKEARKGFFGCYSVCETMKDTKEGYFIV